MPPKVQIPRKRILDTALKLLIEEGQDAISITRLASELGCSTQPISRTFRSMEGFRNALAAHAIRHFNSRTQGKPNEDDPIAMFAAAGENFLRMAYEEPNLVRYIRANSSRVVAQGGIGCLFDGEKAHQQSAQIGQLMHIGEEKALAFMQTMVIYTQGLTSMIVDGSLRVSFRLAVELLRYAGVANMVYAGVDEELAKEMMTRIGD